MARSFKELRRGMSGQRRRQNEETAAVSLAAMELAEIRGGLAVTQKELAARLSISQSNVSRLERRGDMLVSTLSVVVEALGGELQLIAAFPDGLIRIRQFDSRMTSALVYLVDQILPVLKRYGVSRAGVFGSFARGEAVSDSDLDLLVDLPAGSSLLDLVGLQQDLSDLLGLEVDAHTYRSIHPGLRERILNEELRIL